jgi:hypothetical protein
MRFKCKATTKTTLNRCDGKMVQFIYKSKALSNNELITVLKKLKIQHMFVRLFLFIYLYF